MEEVLTDIEWVREQVQLVTVSSPGRVQPGKKMPGQYGNTNVSVKNEVLSFDAESGVLSS